MTIPPVGPPRPLASRTVAAYTADWAAFDAWCAAHYLDSLPAAVDTVTAYLRAEPAAPATLRRRLAAIRNAHRTAGHPPPQVQGPGEGLRRRPGRPAIVDPEQLRLALTRIPLTGWPTALFGCRDSLLLILRYQADLTAATLLGLTPTDLTIDTSRTLLIHTAGDIYALPPDEDPALCPACAWVRWRYWLHRLHTWTAGRLAQQIAEGHHQPPPPIPHRCITAAHRPPTATTRFNSAPVFPSIDRWGNPMPHRPAPATPRTISHLGRAHLRDSPPLHPTTISATPRSELLNGPSISVPVPVDDRDPAERYLAGIQA